MSNKIISSDLKNLIHNIRGKAVMLDKDLAGLYGVETRTLNQAIKRNITRFPEDFMFILTREEILRISQNVISFQNRFRCNQAAFRASCAGEKIKSANRICSAGKDVKKGERQE
jgi:hypothetical protein